MLKNPIPKVTNQLQHRAIGIINGKFTPLSNEQLNRGFLIDNKDEKIETVVLGKALSLLKKHIDLKKSYYWIVYPKNKNTQNLHLQIAGIWDPYQLNDFPNNSSKTNFSILLEELDLKDNYEDKWKLVNKINTSIKIPISLSVSSSNTKLSQELEKKISSFDLVSKYEIEIFNNKEIIYKIIFNGNPNKLLDVLNLSNFKVDSSNKVWKIQ